MIVKAPSVPAPMSSQSPRSSLAIRGLRWFWQFSQFYGEYTVRSPQERQQWLNERRLGK